MAAYRYHLSLWLGKIHIDMKMQFVAKHSLCNPLLLGRKLEKLSYNQLIRKIFDLYYMYLLSLISTETGENFYFELSVFITCCALV